MEKTIHEFEIGIKHRIFNKKLNALIKERGVTNTQLSILLGKSGGTISMMRNFHYNPSEDERIALAIFFNCNIDDIFPEYYDKIYDKLQTSTRESVVHVSNLSIESTEVLQLADESVNIEDESAHRIMSAQLLSIIDSLSEKEATIIKLRHGLLDGTYHRLEDVGKEFGVTRERISQIENKALAKMRQHAHIRRLKSY